METKILNLLKEKKDNFISGQELSGKLNVSRTAVWKHIKNLRNYGYGISAVTHMGYRLDSVPDKMLPDEISYGLKTKVLARKIFAYSCVDSTNDIAYRLAEDSQPEGSLIIAEQQSKGKGRMGRSWVSPAGSGIYMSLILRPRIPIDHIGKMTLMTAVAVAKTIRDITGLGAMIKWPNDIYINGLKVCGILTQISAEPDLINFVIIGIGVNINTSRHKLPDVATSLFLESGKKIIRVEFLQKMLAEIEAYYTKLNKNAFLSIIKDWTLYSMTIGRRIKVDHRSDIIEGQAMEIDESGALIIRDDVGFMHRILSGDVNIIR